MASQITSKSTVYLIICSGQHQANIKTQLNWPFVRGIYWWPVNSPHKGPVTRKSLPFDAVMVFLPREFMLWKHKPEWTIVNRSSLISLLLSGTVFLNPALWRHRRIDLWRHAKARHWNCDVIFVCCSCTYKLPQGWYTLMNINHDFRSLATSILQRANMMTSSNGNNVPQT